MKTNEKLKKFFNSPHPIMIVLTFIIILLFAYNIYLRSSSKLYEFNGISENFYLENGIIYLGRDIHLLNGAKITYMGENMIASRYECGYYFDDGTQISVFKSSDSETTYNLKEVMDSMSFSLFEKKKDSIIFSKKFDIEKIIFKVDAVLEDGTDFKEEVILEFTQLTK